LRPHLQRALSVFNGRGSAYAENLLLILVSGSPATLSGRMISRISLKWPRKSLAVLLPIAEPRCATLERQLKRYRTWAGREQSIRR
jgi:hypothetical protein